MEEERYAAILNDLKQGKVEDAIRKTDIPTFSVLDWQNIDYEGIIFYGNLLLYLTTCLHFHSAWMLEPITHREQTEYKRFLGLHRIHKYREKKENLQDDKKIAFPTQYIGGKLPYIEVSIGKKGIDGDLLDLAVSMLGLPDHKLPMWEVPIEKTLEIATNDIEKYMDANRYATLDSLAMRLRYYDDNLKNKIVVLISILFLTKNGKTEMNQDIPYGPIEVRLLEDSATDPTI